MNKIRTETPCVGLCSTVYGDYVCRGCKRSHEEIVHWNSYLRKEKIIILERLEKLSDEATRQYIYVFDDILLTKQCQLRDIILLTKQYSSYYLAYQLILKGASYINNIENYGIRPHFKVRNKSLPEIRTLIDKSFFSISETHYCGHSPA